MTWNQPLCTADWLEERGQWDGDRLVSFPVPTVVLGTFEERLRQCCKCGRPTTSGILVRLDPSTVPFPATD